jgi:hypothetical protein
MRIKPVPSLPDTDPLLLALIFLAALLYSAVGHGGASGYLAAMGLFGLSAAVMKPAALSLNLFVSGLVWWRLWRAGRFNGRLFLPFAVASMPLAFAGGALRLGEGGYQLIVGAALLLAAGRLFLRPQDQPALRRPPLWAALLSGGALGFLSGLTGVGGGIFLSPLLLFLRWTDMRENAAIAAAFIFVNSAAGLAGHLGSGGAMPDGLALLALAAVAGGAIGSGLATRRLPPPRLKQLLGVVLLIAGGKLLWRGWLVS